MRSALVLIALLLSISEVRGAEDRSAPSLLQFTLHESVRDIGSRLGSDAHSVREKGFWVLEFGEDRNDLGYEWTFYFDQPSGDLLSVTHNLSPAVNVQLFFPASETHYHQYRQTGSQPMNAISRILPGDRVLIAIGADTRNSTCSQMILLRRSALKRFYHWIDAELN
jgi:hypothetical protein